MRIVASPSFRAFPELDRFTDEQCVRLVKASRLGPWFAVAWVVRLAAIASVLVLDFAAVTMIFGSRLRPFALETLLVSALLAVGAAWLVSGDLMRRWLIRRVLRRGGSCGGCRYRLVGLPVGPDRMVTCPECGRTLDVSMFPECCVPATDGVDRFMPSASMVFERTPWWTASRRRALRRSAVAMVLVAAGAYGALLALAWWNVHSARSDLAQLPTAQELCDRINRASGVEIDALERPKPVREIVWYDSPDIERPLNAAFAICNKVQPGLVRWGGGAESAIDPVTLEIAPNPRFEVAELTQSVAALKGWVEGVGGLGRILERMRAPVVPMVLAHPEMASSGLEGVALPPIELLHNWGQAWATIAFMEGDGDAFVDGIELQLALHRYDRSMPLFLRVPCGEQDLRACTALAAMAIRASGQSTGAALAAAIERQSGEPDAEALAAAELDHRRIELCQAMEDWNFEAWNPWMLWSTWSMSRITGRGSTLAGFIPWVGMYGAQRAALDSAGVVMVEQSLLERSARDDAAFVRACHDMALAGPVVGTAGLGRPALVSARDAMLTWRRTLATVVAVERFRAAEGRLPESLDELVPRFVPALPKDPRSDGPLRYQRAPEADTHGFGYRLWSLAPDQSPPAVVPGEPVSSGVEFPPN